MTEDEMDSAAYDRQIEAARRIMRERGVALRALARNISVDEARRQIEQEDAEAAAVAFGESRSEPKDSLLEKAVRSRRSGFDAIDGKG